jgi:uncharacterized protein (TIGR02231 family)
MSLRTKLILLTGVLSAVMASGVFAAAATTTGTISKVTVYRGQALVTRNINIDLPADTCELIVENLPEKIVPESLYAIATGDIKVLSVRYREKAVMEDTREEVKQLDADIENTNKQIYQTTRKKEHLDNQWSMFIKLRDFVVAAKNEDIDRGLLAFEPISKLAEFIQSKGQEYIEQTLAYEEQIGELKKNLELLTRRHQELMAGRSRTERQAVLFLSRNNGRKIAIELNYLVNGANWQQQYNLRAEPQKSNVLIEYNAVINQTSGEDWNGVTLSLSTAEPTMVAAPPILEPMLVSLSSNVQIGMQQAEQQQQIFSEADNARQYQQSRKSNIMKGLAANSELNDLAIRNQWFFLNADRKEIQEFNQKVAEISRTEGISVTYKLTGGLTLPSRSDQQLVTIASIKAKADFTLIATPLLTDYVYLQADLLNDSDTVLLPGQASIFRNDEFVGRSQLPQVTIGETFTAGFGIDSQIKVVQELEDKTTRIQGGNRIDTYNYRIALHNYKNTAVELQLLDRLPYSENSSIKIELGKTEPALSQNDEYLRSVSKKGILRWDLKLSPNSINKDAFVVKYSFTMEYDRNMQIQAQRSFARQ